MGADAEAVKRGEYLQGWLGLDKLNFDPFDDDAHPAEAALIQKRWESIFKSYRELRSPELDIAEPVLILQLMRTFENRMDQFAAWCGVGLEQMHEWLDAAYAV